MPSPKLPKVSVLVPAFNEELNVRRAYDAIVETFRGLPGYDYEIIFTDNHSTDRTFDILRDIARALGATHAAGIVHRDVKPANVIVARDGRAKLVDFGLAKSTHDQALTRHDEVVGTAAFIAPELYLGGVPSAASDAFGFGMLALETMGYYSTERGSQRYPVPMTLLYPATGNFIGFVSNLGSARLLLKARGAFKERTSFPVQTAAMPAAVPGAGWSDHWAFWQAGYPAIMVTDTALFRNPHYHTDSDTPQTLDYGRMAAVVEGLVGVVEVLSAE